MVKRVFCFSWHFCSLFELFSEVEWILKLGRLQRQVHLAKTKVSKKYDPTTVVKKREFQSRHFHYSFYWKNYCGVTFERLSQSRSDGLQSSGMLILTTMLFTFRASTSSVDSDDDDVFRTRRFSRFPKIRNRRSRLELDSSWARFSSRTSRLDDPEGRLAWLTFCRLISAKGRSSLSL